jgi:hypothetical protein
VVIRGAKDSVWRQSPGEIAASRRSPSPPVWERPIGRSPIASGARSRSRRLPSRADFRDVFASCKRPPGETRGGLRRFWFRERGEVKVATGGWRSRMALAARPFGTGHAGRLGAQGQEETVRILRGSIRRLPDADRFRGGRREHGMRPRKRRPYKPSLFSTIKHSFSSIGWRDLTDDHVGDTGDVCLEHEAEEVRK